MNEGYRIMRLIILFDLPVETEEQKKEYRRFRKFLLKTGFFMIQYSVYTRFCHNETDSQKYTSKVVKASPIYGNVRILKITDIQFNNMIVVVGEQSTREVLENKENLIVID